MTNTTTTPRDAATAVVDNPLLPAGDDERVAGFGVMGLPFASGHYLGYRHFPASSFSPGYHTVWHRDPHGTWTFSATTPGPQSCARYFSSATEADPVQCDIAATWLGPWSLRVQMDGLQWDIQLTSTKATRLLSAIGRRLPDSIWANPSSLAVIERTAAGMLRAGELKLSGSAPNGQRFRIAPTTMWAVSGSRAVLRGEDLGAVGPLRSQARLADFRLPQRGVAVVGHAHFETFDAARHLDGSESGSGIRTVSR